MEKDNTTLQHSSDYELHKPHDVILVELCNQSIFYLEEIITPKF